MSPAIRVNHEGGELERFLKSLEPGSAVALEAGLNWMWMVEQIEKADLEPHLTNPFGSQEEDERGRQIRFPGCSRVVDPAAERDAAGSLDTARGAAGSTGTGAKPAGTAASRQRAEVP